MAAFFCTLFDVVIMVIIHVGRHLLRRTTQSPFNLLLTQGAAPGLPFHTASAGHLMMPYYVIALQ